MNRITLKMGLAQAVAIVSSDLIKLDNRRRKFEIYRPSYDLLLRISGPDPNLGWEIVRRLDMMDIFGYLIYEIYAVKCNKDISIFIEQVRNPEYVMSIRQFIIKGSRNT